MSLSDIKMVKVPNYDELSVKNLWPHMQNVPEFMRFMPDSIPKGRLPCREYFFTIMNTLNREYVGSLIRHANEQRHSAANMDMQTETIAISDKMWEQLNRLPFSSGKSTFMPNIV